MGNFELLSNFYSNWFSFASDIAFRPIIPSKDHGATASKINVTLKGTYLPISKLHSRMYYGQVNYYLILTFVIMGK